MQQRFDIRQQQALFEREKVLEQIASAFLADPANAETLAGDTAWEVSVADGLDALSLNAPRSPPR